jgi:hypothetical protein
VVVARRHAHSSRDTQPQQTGHDSINLDHPALPARMCEGQG